MFDLLSDVGTCVHVQDVLMSWFEAEVSARCAVHPLSKSYEPTLYCKNKTDSFTKKKKKKKREYVFFFFIIIFDPGELF